jgi:hypothetical protein
MTGAEAIQQLIETLMRRVPVSVTVGTVKDIGTDKRTCTVEREEQPTLFKVRLNSIIDNYTDNVTVFPKIGSYVLCVAIGSDVTDCYLLATSEVEEIAMKIGNQTLKAYKDGFVFNGGDLGMVFSDKLTEKLNNLEKDLNNLKTVFSTWVVSPQDGGAALKTAVATWAGQTLNETQKAQIEDTNIKH